MWPEQGEGEEMDQREAPRFLLQTNPRSREDHSLFTKEELGPERDSDLPRVTQRSQSPAPSVWPYAHTLTDERTRIRSVQGLQSSRLPAQPSGGKAPRGRSSA